MRVRVTEAGGALGQALAKQLGATGGISVRLTDRPGAEVPTAVEAGDFHRCTFLPDEGTDALVAGVDIICHLVERSCAGQGADDTAWLDACTRDTYNLLRAGVGAGVTKVVLCSSLEVLAPYLEQWGELCLDTAGAWPSWKPLPTCDPEVLGPHMAEYVVTEFAHAGCLRAAVIRLGELAPGRASFATGLAEAAAAVCTQVEAAAAGEPAFQDWCRPAAPRLFSQASTACP